MLLKDLINIQANRALNIVEDENGRLASISGMVINEEQAKTMCKQLGWEEMRLHPFKIIDKTNKFIKSLAKEIDADLANKVDVTFSNKNSTIYGKTYDRITFSDGRGFNYTVIYNMPSSTASYQVFDSKTSIPLNKSRSVKQVAEYLNSRAY